MNEVSKFRYINYNTMTIGMEIKENHETAGNY